MNLAPSERTKAFPASFSSAMTGGIPESSGSGPAVVSPDLSLSSPATDVLLDSGTLAALGIERSAISVAVVVSDDKTSSGESADILKTRRRCPQRSWSVTSALRALDRSYRRLSSVVVGNTLSNPQFPVGNPVSVRKPAMVAR